MRRGPESPGIAATGDGNRETSNGPGNPRMEFQADFGRIRTFSAGFFAASFDISCDIAFDTRGQKIISGISKPRTPAGIIITLYRGSKEMEAIPWGI